MTYTELKNAIHQLTLPTLEDEENVLRILSLHSQDLKRKVEEQRDQLLDAMDKKHGKKRLYIEDLDVVGIYSDILALIEER